MPSWGQILNETNNSMAGGDSNAPNKVRQKYLKALSDFTKRDTIVYASRWTAGGIDPNLVSITDEDLQGFLEAAQGLKSGKLDLILHTGGGQAEAADAIVSFLRQTFDHIRVIIPQAAMSGGTMIACSAEEIVMSKHSFLGPIDPQFIIQNSGVLQAVAAHAILEQFARAQEEIKKDPAAAGAWIPILPQYGPALLVQCQNQIDFGRNLIKNWLDLYMFKGEGGEKADLIAKHLSEHSNFKTHSKHINNIEAKNLGLKIIDLEENLGFYEAAMSAFHAVMINFNFGAVKIICNQMGNLFVKSQQIISPFQQRIPMQPQPIPQPQQIRPR
jgi:ATP-dependent protease ClpP protease subunit